MSEKCPLCGSENIETMYHEDEYGMCHVIDVCQDCHFDWEEYP
jgi:transposase-like protein